MTIFHISTEYKGGKEIRRKIGDWEPILYRREFDQIIDRFLNDVRENYGYMEQM